MEKILQNLKEMMLPGYNWEEHWNRDLPNSGIDDVFRQCYRWHDYRKGNRAHKTSDCGSVKFPDTPKALYRMLYLLGPAVVDFSDMYKTGTLVDITDPDELYLCSFQLWKYEASLYFGCPKEFLIDEQEGQAMRLTCGIPGFDNGVKCSDPLGNLFFEVATMALNFEHGVYPGNNFEV